MEAQDWLHLILCFDKTALCELLRILGVLCTVVFIVVQIVEIALQQHCHTPFCIGQLVSAILIIPSLYDFFKFIGTYDESLQAWQCLAMPCNAQARSTSRGQRMRFMA